MKSDGIARGLLWISPWLTGFIAFMAIPMGMSGYYSFTDYPLIEDPVWIGLENYRELMRDRVFWITVRNTLVYGTASVIGGGVLALALAVLLNQRLRFAPLVRAAVFVPTLLPLVAVSLAWMWIFNGEFGLLNTVLGWIGIEGPNWLGERTYAMLAIIIVGLWSVGGAVVINLAALQDVPPGMLEAARIDGAGAWSRFRHVTLPMISPALLFNVLVGMIWSLQIFAVPHVMTQGGPDNATNFYTMYLYQNAFVYQRMGYASAMAWIQFAAIGGLTLIALGLSRRLVHYRSAP